MSDVKLYKILKTICILCWVAFFVFLALNFKTGDESWRIAISFMAACITTIMLSKLKSGYY